MRKTGQELGLPHNSRFHTAATRKTPMEDAASAAGDRLVGGKAVADGDSPGE